MAARVFAIKHDLLFRALIEFPFLGRRRNNPSIEPFRTTNPKGGVANTLFDISACDKCHMVGATVAGAGQACCRPGRNGGVVRRRKGAGPSSPGDDEGNGSMSLWCSGSTPDCAAEDPGSNPGRFTSLQVKSLSLSLSHRSQRRAPPSSEGECL